MEVLDRALATAYVSKYPEEAKRIHMGKDDEVIDAETEYGSVKKSSPKKKQTPKKIIPVKKAATPKKKILPKKKVLEARKKKSVEAAKTSTAKSPAHKAGPKSKTVAGPKSKTRPAPRSAKKSGSVSNGGGSSSKSYVTPSLMGGGSAKKKPSGPTKVSAKLFKGKKRSAPAAKDSDESDIEILDDDEVKPPAAKKPRPGPKSRTR